MEYLVLSALGTQGTKCFLLPQNNIFNHFAGGNEPEEVGRQDNFNAERRQRMKEPTWACVVDTVP